MYDDRNWTAVTGDALAGIVKMLNPVDGKYPFSPETAAVAWHPLPFYEKAILMRIEDSGWPSANLTFYYLSLDGLLYRLNGTSPPIHEVNERAPISITAYISIIYLTTPTINENLAAGGFHDKSHDRQSAAERTRAISSLSVF